VIDINRVMLAGGVKAFSKAPFFIDWTDVDFGASETFIGGIQQYLNKASYNESQLKFYTDSSLPSEVNPFAPPRFTCPRADKIRLRLHIAAGMQARFSSSAPLKYLGFEGQVANSGGWVFASTNSGDWTILTANDAPKTRLSSTSSSIDIEKVPAINTIEDEISFSIPRNSVAERDDAALVYHLRSAFNVLERTTNIKLGVEKLASDRFAFQFLGKESGSLAYHVSANLAARMKAPTSTVTETTEMGKAENFDNEEEVATLALNSKLLGVIYVCSPQGKTDYYPGKLLAVLHPQADAGGFCLNDNPWDVPPPVADGHFISRLYNGMLELEFFTHSPLDNSFYPLRWHGDLRFQAGIAYRRAIKKAEETRPAVVL